MANDKVDPPITIFSFVSFENRNYTLSFKNNFQKCWIFSFLCVKEEEITKH